jgi:sterol desaturase/sphingolipid hydroxylase (fatty acid hydroxylase superfamily)
LGAIVSAALLRTPFLSTTLDELIPAKMPIAGAGVVSLVLLDGVLYAWHRMNHRIPVLWRFHRVHHSDPAMDASTSIRFHPGEFLLATAASALQWTLVGGRLDLYLFYDVAVLVAVPFHHANLRLPGKLDALLQKLFITPEIHGIHHSVRPEETDSNFGTVFSVWDRILGTARMRAPASEIQVGLRPPLREKLIALLLSPFRL